MILNTEQSDMQAMAVNNTLDILKTDDCAQAWMTTASGKSRTGSLIYQGLNGGLSLWVVHTKDLARQMAFDIQNNSTKLNPFIVIVASDKNAGRLKGKQVIPVISSSHQIADVMMSHKNVAIVTLFHSFDKVNEAQELVKQKKRKRIFDFCLIDEVDLYSGNKEKKNVRIYDRGFIKIKKRVGLTGTVKVSDNGELYYGLNDEQRFGKLAFELTYKEAFDSGFVSEFFTCISMNEREEVLELLSQLEGVEEEDINYVLSAFSIINAHRDGIPNGKKKLKISSGLVYVNEKKKAYRFKMIFEQVLDVIGEVDWFVDVLVGEHSVDKRNKVIDEFKQRARSGVIKKYKMPSLIINVNLFKRGTSINEVDFIGLVDPRNGVTSVAQIYGRGFRKCEGKKYCVILMGANIDGNNIDTSMELFTNDYSKAIDIGNTIQTNDNIIAEKIRERSNNGIAPTKQELIEHNPIVKNPNIITFGMNKKIGLKLKDKVWSARVDAISQLLDYNTNDNYLTIHEVAKLLNLTHTAIRLYVNKGRLKTKGKFINPKNKQQQCLFFDISDINIYKTKFCQTHELLNTREVAEYLSLKIFTIQTWPHSKLAFIKNESGRKLYNITDVEKYKNTIFQKSILLNIPKVAELLNISTDIVRPLLKKHNIEPITINTKNHKLFNITQIELLKNTLNEELKLWNVDQVAKFLKKSYGATKWWLLKNKIELTTTNHKGAHLFDPNQIQQHFNKGNTK